MAVSIAAILPAHADRVLTYTSPQNGNGEMTLTVAGNRAAMQMPDQSGERTRIIYDHEADKIYLANDSQQQYMDMDELGEAMSGLAGMMSGMMDNLSDDQKAQMGDLLGNLTGNKEEAEPAAAPTITKTGESDTVAGIGCEVVLMESAGSSSEMCIASPADAGLNANDFAVLQGMMIKQTAIASQASEMLGSSAMSFNPGKLDGVPVRVKQVSGADSGSNSELLRTSGDVDAAAVVIPDSYQPMKITAG